MKKLKQMPLLKGEIPLVYKKETIFNICAVVNALARAVNYLNEKIERLEERDKDGGS